MENEKELQQNSLEETAATVAATAEAVATVEDTETPLDKNVRLMSPTRMLLRRFFRSKLSMAGIIMLAALFIFCWFGPIVYQVWGEIETDRNGAIEYAPYQMNGFVQLIVTDNGINSLAKPSIDHLLGTDEQGMDIFTRLMYGGRLSLSISFIAVFLTSFWGLC